ncbi:transcription initiation factor IIE2 [Cavenderia fasciculata]|uniref:Transcription initiation factor IIE subunit beta n=1 Tax=Cavenderia fasciculata TaxID=261658 RepID=F4QBS7_CACFS|nr:transcription initiation factor IIE2 [Cavenderia fasciculata]EGG14665.1 transcription initiation factor IIE2 [Cavenderia fasciculata]|eukprot:XP_004351173.1 transcription initiation factor IIE2 [Cavenderia fasciculata]
MDTKSLPLKKPSASIFNTNGKRPLVSASMNNRSASSSSSSNGSGGGVYMSASVAGEKKTPTGRIIFDVVIHLRSLEGRPATLEELMISTGHKEIIDSQLVQDELKQNEKVEFLDSTTVRFKPLYRVKTPEEIVDLLKEENPRGIPLNKLTESYAKVGDDVKKLKESKEIYTIKNTELNTEILFYNDEKYRIPVSDELIKMWKNIPIPNDVDLVKTMKDIGLSVVESVEAAKTTKSSKAGKSERKHRITKVTNVHIKDFDPNAPDAAPPPKNN